MKLPDMNDGVVSMLGPLSVSVVTLPEVKNCTTWSLSFSDQRKDRRYYEIVEDTLRDNFEYKYFAISDGSGFIHSVQPFFILQQDILEGVGPLKVVEAIRKLWPRFLRLRTLMVGCSAGEGHLASNDNVPAAIVARILSQSIAAHAAALGARMIVLKEFPSKDRSILDCFLQEGYVRIPSMPMTRLNIAYDDFEAYLESALPSSTRRKLRKNLRASAGSKIDLRVVEDIAPYVDEIYPLYLQVFARSKMKFEKLTREYFVEVGRKINDKARFFIWTQAGRPIAFSMCMIRGDSLFAEYVGFDYAVALDLHLYHYAVRDMISWAMSRGYKWFCSSALGYDPKLHMRHELDPVDLYVRFTLPFVNPILKRLVPWLEPVRRDKTLAKFANYRDLW